jgi:AcrR family transcriptional regulator
MLVQIDQEDEVASPSDGRHRRTDASKARIVAAMIALVREGVMAPRADVVAEKAGVGLRTVFRLFRDMDSLYGEMHREVMAATEPLFNAPLPETEWPARFKALAQRRAAVFEQILPLQIAGEIQRHRSAFLQASHHRFVRMQRKLVEQTLPDWLRADSQAVDALDAALCFDMWKHLRINNGRSVADAAAIVWRIITPLTKQPPTDGIV